jgi:hypothetical protein
MPDSIIIAVVMLTVGMLWGYMLQPLAKRQKVRQVVAEPEPEATGATVAEIVQFKQAGRQKGGKRR